MKNTLFIFAIILYTATSAVASGWPKPKGEGYFKLYEWWIISDRHYTDQGLLDPNLTNGFFNTSIYAEYGFTNRLTGIANIPVFSRAYFNNTVSEVSGEVLTPGESLNSFGDTDIGIKYGLITKGPVAVSGRIMFGLPLGKVGQGTGGVLQTGDGEFNQLLQFDAGTGFKLGKIPAYANIYAGFNQRSKGFSDEFRYGVEAGLNLVPNKLWVIGRLFGIESLNNGNSQEGVSGASLFANNSEHLTVSPEVAWYLTKNIGVSVSMGTAISGKLIFANPSWSVGVFYDLK